MNRPTRLVIIVRADPVICGHSVEARNLAETALERGFTDVRIVTWPIERLEAAGLPLKPLDRVLPYSAGITVERPEPVGDYKVPDGRYLAGIIGRLVELFTDGVPTVCLSLYLSPHTIAVADALRVAWSTGLPVNVTTIAEAVGSDVTNVVRSAVAEGRFGAAAHVLSSYLAQDHCVAVSEYTRELIVESAAEVDALHGTSFAAQCQARVEISYPAIDSSPYLDLDDAEIDRVLAARGLERGVVRAVPLAARAGEGRRRPHPRIRAQRRPRRAPARDRRSRARGRRAACAGRRIGCRIASSTSSTTSATPRSRTSWRAARRSCCRASRDPSSSRRSASRSPSRCSRAAAR